MNRNKIVAGTVALALALPLALSITASNSWAWDLGLGKKAETAEKASEPTPEQVEQGRREEAKAALEKNQADLAPKTPEDFYAHGLDLFKVAQQQAEKGNLNGQKALLKEAITQFEKAVNLATAPPPEAKKPDEKKTPEKKSEEPASTSKVSLKPRAAVPKVAIEAQSNIGFAYLTLKNYKEAVKAFQAALKWNPKHLNTINGLGTTYAFDKKEDLALQTFEELVSLDPGNPQFFFNQGSVLQKFERYEEAKEAYQKALNLEPKDQRTLFNLATLFENLGELSEARPLYARAKDVAIETPIGLEAYHRIEVIDARIKQAEQDEAQKANLDAAAQAKKNKKTKPFAEKKPDAKATAEQSEGTSLPAQEEALP